MYYNYEYNIEGLLESKSSSGKTLLSYTYDKNNNIKSIKDITGKSSKYTYDKANRVKAILDDKDEIQAQYEYYNNDNVKSVTLGNGVKSDYNYDGDGNVENLVTVTQNGEVLVDYNYVYDLNGNRLQKVSSKYKNYYSYDSMNRLVDSSYDNRCESFTYDKAGNRLTKTTNDITEKYVYNVKNQLKELHHKDGVNLFTYDKQGNTLQEQTITGNNIFEYNTLNQQVKAITKEGNTLVNRYDSEGLRYEIEENEKLAKFIFNKNGDILAETDSDDNVVSRFTRGYEIVSADIADQTNSPTNFSLSRYYYSVDEQGSTDFITDSSGKVRNEYWYDAFGNVLDSKEDVHNRITYTGQQFDGVTQQYYLRARFYNPVVGRFTQEDVYRGDGLNLYAYCGNNPVGYFDPSGYVSENLWNKFRTDNKGKGFSIKNLSEKYKDTINKNIKITKESLRQKYMGSTPTKDSNIGKQVVAKMDEYGLMQKDKSGKVKYFKSLTDGQYYKISEADMSHKNSTFEKQLENYNGVIETGHKDAVDYWNTTGKYYGPKSDEVKAYMKNPDNYYLEHKKYNRSDGASLKNEDGTRKTYDEPIANKCTGKGRSSK